MGNTSFAFANEGRDLESLLSIPPASLCYVGFFLSFIWDPKLPPPCPKDSHLSLHCPWQLPDVVFIPFAHAEIHVPRVQVKEQEAHGTWARRSPAVGGLSSSSLLTS